MRQSILLILTLLGCLITVFAPIPAQAATNNLGATVYDQNNQGTSAGASFSGNVIQTPNFTTIDFTNLNPTGRQNHWSVLIEGFIYAPTDGVYQFETLSDDGIRVIVDGTLTINNWTDHPPTTNTGSVNLLTGWKSIRIEFYEKAGGDRLRFRWKQPGAAGFSFPPTANLSSTLPPADPTNGNTTLATSPTSVAADGSTTSSVVVTLADANGNPLTTSGGTVTLSSTGSAVISTVSDNGDGTYSASVTNIVAEAVTISGTVNSSAITDTATVTFTAGSADPTNGNTTLATSPTSVAADGSTTSSVVVTLADANGNPLTTSGGTVTLSSTGSAVISTVSDNGDGTYSASVTNIVAEAVTISGTVNSSAITDTATVTFMDTSAPNLSNVSISSNNPDASKAMPGDIVTLNFTASETIQSPSVTFLSGGAVINDTVTIQNTNAENWKASYSVNADDALGLITFGISFSDIANNSGTSVSTTSDGTSVERQKTSNEEFTEVKRDIEAQMKISHIKQIDIFLNTTRTTVGSARDRLISKRTINSRSVNSSYSPYKNPLFNDSISSSSIGPDWIGGKTSRENYTESSFELRLSTGGTKASGQINGLSQSLDGRNMRYTETLFNYSKSENDTETSSASSQIIFERKKSEDLTTGHFIGFSLNENSTIDKHTIDIEAVGLQVGVFFVENIENNLFIDGYLSASLLTNNLKVTTSSIIAEADYVNRLGAAGAAVTGSINIGNWEILPTLAVDYTLLSSQDAAFEVTSAAGNSSELISPGNLRKLSLTYSPDFRTELNYNDSRWFQSSKLSFKPKFICQRVEQYIMEKECGQGAALSLNSQDKNGLKTVNFSLAIDKISSDTTYSANALYTVEF